MKSTNTKTKTASRYDWKAMIKSVLLLEDKKKEVADHEQTLGHSMASQLVIKMREKAQTLQSAKEWFNDMASKNLPAGNKAANLKKVSAQLNAASVFVPYLESGLEFENPLTAKQAQFVNGVVEEKTGKPIAKMRGEDWRSAYDYLRESYGLETLKKQAKVKKTDADDEELDHDIFFTTAQKGEAKNRVTPVTLEKTKDQFSELIEMTKKLSNSELKLFDKHVANKGYRLTKA